MGDTQRWATVLTIPDGTGYGRVRVDGGPRRCYFEPTRFVAPWPVPVAGARVAVADDRARTLTALWVLGRGVPV
jgi:hypothetical protein